jgi:ATP-binding protein involved in chromosome partitioning
MSSTAHPLLPAVNQALKGVMDPEIRQSIVELGMLNSVEINEEGGVHVVVDLTTPGCPLKRQIHADVASRVMEVEGVTDVSVEFGYMTTEQRTELRANLRGVA